MAYEIVLDDVAARPIAVVHASVPIGHVGVTWRPALDKVWAFLRRNDGLRTDGHNIFVYHHPVLPGAPMAVDFGVEVSRPFEPADEIVFTQTPAGPVAPDGARRSTRAAGRRQRRDRSVVRGTWPPAGRCLVESTAIQATTQPRSRSRCSTSSAEVSMLGRAGP